MRLPTAATGAVGVVRQHRFSSRNPAGRSTPAGSGSPPEWQSDPHRSTTARTGAARPSTAGCSRPRPNGRDCHGRRWTRTPRRLPAPCSSPARSRAWSQAIRAQPRGKDLLQEPVFGHLQPCSVRIRKLPLAFPPNSSTPPLVSPGISHQNAGDRLSGGAYVSTSARAASALPNSGLTWELDCAPSRTGR